MGGLGSGRRKDRGRKTVESYWMLDVDQLAKKGCLRPGWFGTCQWAEGNEIVSINLRAEVKRLHLSYTVRVESEERQDMAETISIVHLRCRFGGSRAYFICLDLETVPCADGASPSCTSRAAIFYADIAITCRTRVSTKTRGSGHSGGPTN